MRVTISILALLAAVSGCGASTTEAASVDSGQAGSGTTDAVAADTGAADTGAADTGAGSGGSCAGAGTACTQGEALKDVELQNCAGEKVRIADIVCAGKASVVYFGGGWCQPCRDKQAKLQEWYTKNHAQGLDVVTILKEQSGPGDPATRAFCQEWTEQYGLDFPVYIDPTDKITTACLGTAGTLPITLVVAPDWRIVYKDVGGDAADAEATFLELLAL